MKAEIARPRRRALVPAIALAIAANTADAATITVNSNDDSAASTFCNLRDAIASINNAAASATCSAAATGAFGSDDTIVFAALANSTITLAQGELTVSKPTKIEGGGWTIDADGKSTAIYADYADLTINDLTIQNGFDANSPGGIFAVGGKLALNGVAMTHNQGSNGGAISAFTAVKATTVTVTDSNIHDNYAYSGGAIFSQNSYVTVTNSLLSHNGAKNAGGAIAVDGGTLAVADSVLIGNYAKSGGAINNSGVTTLTHSILSANTATDDGGAIDVTSSNSDITITGSTISGNSAANGGAINTRFGGTFAVLNSTLASNTASVRGGAIYGYKYPNITLTNATISGNGAAQGGGIYIKPNAKYSGNVMTFFNSIVSANSAPSGADIAGYYSVLTGNNNLFGSGLDKPPFNDAGNHNVFSDSPGLGPLQNNGGFTDTRALLTGSPAIDAGSNGSASGLTTDQRGEGFVRVENGIVDIGAYEYLGDRVFANGFEPGS